MWSHVESCWVMLSHVESCWVMWSQHFMLSAHCHGYTHMITGAHMFMIHTHHIECTHINNAHKLYWGASWLFRIVRHFIKICLRFYKKSLLSCLWRIYKMYWVPSWLLSINVYWGDFQEICVPARRFKQDVEGMCVWHWVTAALHLFWQLLQRVAVFYSVLQRPARCNILLHTTTHCSIK